ncbi:hypothetical protein HUU51_03325 [Candidatus Gracilibacteria bacterium]|nr:hypothetical protein [Candidatus Gracilibacteria bacterium]
MKKIIYTLFISLVIIIALIVCKIYLLNNFNDDFNNLDSELEFQYDADLARLEHLEYWTSLIEEFYDKNSYYPLQEQLKSNDSIGLVRIATKEQQRFFDKTNQDYKEYLDNNGNDFFQEFSINKFILELEEGLSKTIDEKYDIQKYPTNSPIWYNYFVTERGYLLWITCMTCGVTPISTLLYDGLTPTLNIASVGMKEEVFKSLTRDEMLNHPIYKLWKERKYNKEGFIREREKENIKNSKE